MESRGDGSPGSDGKSPQKDEGGESRPFWRSPLVYVPITVALITVVGGVLQAVISSSGKSDSPRLVTPIPLGQGGPTGGGGSGNQPPTERDRSAERSPSAPSLQIIDALPVNRPLKKAVSRYNAVDASGVILTLRNPGPKVSVVNRARLVITRFATLSAQSCAGEGEGGKIPTSAHYRARMPLVAGAGDAVVAHLRQQVPPNSADRLEIGLALDDPGNRVFTTPTATGASRVYTLTIELYHDGVTRPLRSAPVIVAIPFPWYGVVLRPTGSTDSGACGAHNLAILHQMLAGGAARSDDLDTFAKNPSAAACASRDAVYCRQ
jgi:hypothetical protein